jgi:L-amino acid N-acyltransferase YncA
MSIIRRGLVTDVGACAALESSIFNIFTREKRAKAMRDHVEGLVVAETPEGQLAGYALAVDEFFACSTFLKLVVVSEAHRRKGVASGLIERVWTDLTPTRRLFSSTEADNAPSRAMHEKMGFRECGYIEGLPQPERELFFVRTA